MSDTAASCRRPVSSFSRSSSAASVLTAWMRLLSEPQLAAAAILAAAFLCSPHRALATCGDYLLVRDASGRLVPASEFNGQETMQRHQGNDPARLPCRGPSCSGAPSAPAAPTTPVSSPPPLKGLLTGTHVSSQQPSARWQRATAEPAVVIHHPGRVFRPPR